jgi:hypothetical protein
VPRLPLLVQVSHDAHRFHGDYHSDGVLIVAAGAARAKPAARPGQRAGLNMSCLQNTSLKNRYQLCPGEAPNRTNPVRS